MQYRIITCDTIVVGTGAAGYNAACRLKGMGKAVALVTEGVNCGTSRNTGSDKQTYYKLGLSGDSPDSVRRMAENLFSGGAVDGDNALCEAALSARCFLNLCELGVEFPVNRYGEYVGYKTDHDPFERATSAGPLTSKFMTEALEKQARALEIPVYDGLLAVEILKDETGVCGLACLEKKSGKPVFLRCAQVILATGGPAGIYADSVYPACHTGSGSLALQAGAEAQNLTEWQFGLASIAPRWNVSGTYMQVLPRFVSVDAEGVEREFLLEYFGAPYAALSMVFLKGYQWPFDSRKAQDGSSVIDLLVYRERVLRGRRVYLDYRQNPFGLEQLDYEKLAPEAAEYLRKAEACFGTPYARLQKMNQPAIALYRSKGCDLETERLEIALCAQHHNGGTAVDLWWQTAVPGLFAVGECAGTHGVTRPGGSALNAGQVGSLRAATYIAEKGRTLPEEAAFAATVHRAAARHAAFCERILNNPDNVEQEIARAQRRMSDTGGAIRRGTEMETLRREIAARLAALPEQTGVSGPESLWRAYKLLDILRTQQAVLTAMIDFDQTVGATRGSALYCDAAGENPRGLEEIFRFRLAGPETGERIQTVRRGENEFRAAWRPVRPLPTQADFFENVWRTYRENKNVF